jgi:multidrug efflux pump subunit AcrA (membrane-fusion protein)
MITFNRIARRLSRNLFTWGLPALAVSSLTFVALTTMQRLYSSQEEIPATLLPQSIPYEGGIAAIGFIEPISQEIIIGSAIEGVVEKTYVATGDQVKKGTPLFSLDSRQRRKQLEVAQAQVLVQESLCAKAEVELKQAQERFAFYEQLEDGRAVSADDFTTKKFNLLLAEKGLAIAQKQLVASKAQLAYSQEECDQLTIYAPMDGEILKMQIREGQYFSNKNSESLLIMGDTSKLHVIVQVEESQLSFLELGRPAVSFMNNLSAKPIPLKFVKVRPVIYPKKSLGNQPGEKTDTRVLELEYLIERKNGPLYPGQQLDVFIERGNP